MSDDSTLLKQENERYKAIIDILLNENRQLKTKLSFLAGNDGKSESIPSDDIIQGGKVESNYSNLTSNEGTMLTTSSLPLLNDEKVGVDVSLLIHQLRKEMLTSRDIGLHNAAKLLIHFVTQPQNTHKHLTTLTGLTISGLAKHIHMLKKRGLIVRSGYQTFSLTQKSIALLQNAVPA